MINMHPTKEGHDLVSSKEEKDREDKVNFRFQDPEVNLVSIKEGEISIGIKEDLGKDMDQMVTRLLDP